MSRLGVGESLVKLNDELKVEACLADSWENVDETTWKFHIREGVTFSNGKAVDAEAAKASIERAISMNDRAAEYLKIDSMEADGQDLTIKRQKPMPPFLNNLVEPVFDVIDTTESEEIFRQRLSAQALMWSAVLHLNRQSRLRLIQPIGMAQPVLIPLQ